MASMHIQMFIHLQLIKHRDIQRVTSASEEVKVWLIEILRILKLNPNGDVDLLCKERVNKLSRYGLSYYRDKKQYVCIDFLLPSNNYRIISALRFPKILSLPLVHFAWFLHYIYLYIYTILPVTKMIAS